MRLTIETDRNSTCVRMFSLLRFGGGCCIMVVSLAIGSVGSETEAAPTHSPATQAPATRPSRGPRIISPPSNRVAVRPNVRQATLTAPFAHPISPVAHPGSYAPQPFRWGWFGAAYHPPVPMMHQDYNEGWREWHYRR